ncbi:MAG: TonB-dependent receptor [Woeseiaceae bacterium]|nr:TonB-dependent receptor [Woeseiaceae bacterium]
MRPLSALLVSSLLLAGASFAQSPAPTAAGVSVSEDGATVTYDATFFIQYEPLTALDMLRWIPGTGDIVPEGGGGGGGNQARGFGSGGDQVLINGKRLSGKSIDISAAVQRIQARSVDRIEVIRGTTSGLDVRSRGLLVNIVLSEEADRGSATWQMHAGDYHEAGTAYDGLISYSRRLGDFNYLLSAEYGPFNRGTSITREETFFAPGTDEIIERRMSIGPRLNENLRLNASGSWTFDNGDILNLNAQFEDASEDEKETTMADVVGVPGTEIAVDTTIEDEIAWEFGGDLDNSIGSGTLKTRLILTREDEEERETVQQTSTVPGDLPEEAFVFSEEERGESILRTSYSWPALFGQTLELGVEGARNTLDANVQLFEQQPDGSLVEVPVGNASSKVVEDRYEVFSTLFWNLSTNQVLEAALNFEVSTIEQTGIDVSNSRRFEFLKPRFDYRLDLNERDQLRATLERTVSQLDFGDFVSSFDRDDDRIDGGNPDLVPEKAWEWALTFEHRLEANAGLVSGRVFYNDIEDHIDRIQVAENISGTGNIGAAEEYGIELRGSLQLGMIGLDGAVIDVVYTRRETSAIDPFTGDERPISNRPEQEGELKFRHDIPSLNFNYLIDLRWRGRRYENDISFREVQFDRRPRTNITAQYRFSESLNLFMQARVPDRYAQRREREFFVGNIADGNPLRDEVRDQYFEPEYILGLRGQF